MKGKSFLVWMALLLCFVGFMTIWFARRAATRESATSANPDRSATAMMSETPLEEFTLTDQRGRKFGSHDLDGKVWVASFFFSSCPTTCRELNMQVANLQREFEGKEVHFVSITVDPKRDTPTQLAAYADLFGANPERWHMLTGEFEYIRRIGEDYMKVSVDQETHSSRLILIDRDGILRDSFSSSDPNEVAELKRKLTDMLEDSANV